MDVPESVPTHLKQRYQLQQQLWQQSFNELNDNSALKTQFLIFTTISDYLSAIASRYPKSIKALLTSDDINRPYTQGDYVKKLSGLVSSMTDEGELMKCLRQFRHQESFRLAWRELAGESDLTQTLKEQTALADACIKSALQLIQLWKQKKYGVPLGQDGEAQSLIVIALGKLGGGELNFSSDIDFCCVYPANGSTDSEQHAIVNDEFFNCVVQQLTKVLHQVNADGFVYRVDMRLRPFGASGPLVMSFSALSNYLQEQGRDWERYAYIKARYIGGDKRSQQQLHEIIKPFVYRRYVDFSAIEAMRSLKQTIEREIQLQSLSEDIKRGFGGIREIEFICQAFQLIHGGQNRLLRESNLMRALQQLAKNHYLPQQAVEQLQAAYAFYRRLENVLQIRAEQQTHALPSQAQAIAQVCWALGYVQYSDLLLELKLHRQAVHEHFSNMLAPVKRLAVKESRVSLDEINAVWSGQLSKSSAYSILNALGFDNTEEVQQLLADFNASRRIRELGQIAQARLEKVLPDLLCLIGQANDPELTLKRLLSLLNSIVRRSAYLALLLENPQAIQHLIHLFSCSAWIADQVCAQPFLLEELLTQESIYQPMSEQALSEELQDNLSFVLKHDLEEKLEVLRRFKLRQMLRVASADIENKLPTMQVSEHLSHTAKVIIETVHAMVEHELQQKHPDLDLTGHFAVIAYGKFGGLELSYSSDLDLVFLHDFTSDLDTYPMRIAQRITHILSTRTAAGVLYEVDTRLRPSGSAGLLVSRVDAFVDYQQNSAWTWEHQALVKARMVSGPDAIEQRFSQIRDETLSKVRDKDQLQIDVADMRQKQRHSLEHKQRDTFDIKQSQGGMVDIEFLVQFAVLAWAHQYPQLLQFTDNIRCLQQLVSLALLTEQEGELLQNAYVLYRQHVHLAILQNQSQLASADQYIDWREGVKSIWTRFIMPAPSDRSND